MMRSLLFLSAAMVVLGTAPSAAQGFLERLYMTAPCYVKTVKPLRLRSGQPVPVGVDIGITADAGGSWLTTDERNLPLIAKSDGSRPDCIDYKPVIDGKVSRPTAVYERVPALGSGPSMKLATRIQPGRDGYVIPPGESLRISRREGDYFLADTTAQRQILLPVGVVEAPADALKSGHAVVLPQRSMTNTPPPPQETPGSQPTAGAQEPLNGPLYGRLRIPLSLGRRVLDAGSYIQIGYDAGEQWVVGVLMPMDAPRISKAAVELVGRTVYQSPLLGRVRNATPTYDAVPNLDRDPTRLLQSGPGGFLNPRLSPGQEVNIRAREGDTLEVVPIVAGQRSELVRVPASAIEVIHGDSNSGRPVRVPILSNN